METEGLNQVSERLLHTELDGFVVLLKWVAAGIDVLSILVILIGTTRFCYGFLRAEFSDRDERVSGIDSVRIEIGRYILAGLELFIVSDIIHAALSLAMSDLLFLGLLVLIRSAISFFLEREMREIRDGADTTRVIKP